MRGNGPSGDHGNQDLYVHVTDADVHAARAVWRRASDVDPSSDRTAALYESYRQVVHAQAQQIAEEFRAARAL